MISEITREIISEINRENNNKITSVINSRIASNAISNSISNAISNITSNTTGKITDEAISEKHQLLYLIYDRLCFHCGFRVEEFCCKRERFVVRLLAYPDDLLCAAYSYLLKHTPPDHLPDEEEFIEFMSPEFKRRNNDAQKALGGAFL